jgi:hypothetical protein
LQRHGADIPVPAYGARCSHLAVTEYAALPEDSTQIPQPSEVRWVSLCTTVPGRENALVVEVNHAGPPVPVAMTTSQD